MMFQFHITLDAVPSERLGRLRTLCARGDAKPVLIRLAKGDHVDQPMITIMQQAADLDEALLKVRHRLADFASQGFRIVRTKAEIDPAHNEDYHDESNYYEWHGLVRCDDDDALTTFCKQWGAHLSRNMLTEGHKFVTVRAPMREAFYERVSAISGALRLSGYEIVKEKFEYSVYDTRIELDKGWA